MPSPPVLLSFHSRRCLSLSMPVASSSLPRLRSALWPLLHSLASHCARAARILFPDGPKLFATLVTPLFFTLIIRWRCWFLYYLGSVAWPPRHPDFFLSISGTFKLATLQLTDMINPCDLRSKLDEPRAPT